MNHKNIAFIVLFTSLYLLSGCNNQPKATTTPPVEAPKMENHSQHSMAMMQTMDAMMQRANTMKMTGDFDIDFASMMIEHHQGAIDMSEVELQHGADTQMKGMAQQIITAQKAEIAKMRAFIQAHPATAKQQPMAMQIMQMMHDQMKAMPMSGNVDQDFASMMKIHHQGAVTMAQEAVSKGHHADIKSMAQQMITDQQKEIAAFQTWLDKNRK
ncbi:MAG: DUF305 domain-containing protein [Saprospiraceae bacterium]|nr:DUF305 domain-containing protein [Saprospiraceae bacterium]